MKATAKAQARVWDRRKADVVVAESGSSPSKRSTAAPVLLLAGVMEMPARGAHMSALRAIPLILVFAEVWVLWTLALVQVSHFLNDLNGPGYYYY